MVQYTSEVGICYRTIPPPVPGIVRTPSNIFPKARLSSGKSDNEPRIHIVLAARIVQVTALASQWRILALEILV